ncbi:MAG: DUF1015 domain-containing protein [Opitutaceae bacterium]|nr:DUF1015 domain-containing protein [Opitutaceae bacterium]
MRIRAFQGLRPSQKAVKEIASLPYDVVSTEEARALAKDNPLSMLHVVRAEIDLPEGTDPYSDAVYQKAKENLERLQKDKNLIRDSAPSLFIYQQQMGSHIQRGLVALCHIDDYEAGLIKKHEKTRPQKENDRTRLTSDLAANTGPVFLTYPDNSTIDGIIDTTCKEAPLYDFTAEDAIRHTVWKISDEDSVLSAFIPVAAFYVADGHHRAASAARVGKERHNANPSHTGNEDYNWFLTVLFPSSQLKVLSYNRLVADLNGHSAEQILEYLQKTPHLTLSENANPEPQNPGEVSLYLNKKWYGLKLEVSSDADPVARLDVSMLQDRVLSPLLGIDDPRTNTRVEFVGGIRGTSELEKRVDSGSAAIAFSLYPFRINQLIDISDADQIMPPKSTWFEPKLRSGLFIHTFEK